MGDLGTRNNLSKSELINNWHKIQGVLEEEGKQEEDAYELDLNISIQKLTFTYVDLNKEEVLCLNFFTNFLRMRKNASK